MKSCKLCGNEFKPQKGFKNYCSLKCRNTRYHSIETRNKISNSLINSKKAKIAIENRLPMDISKLKIYRKNRRDKADMILMSKSWDELGIDSKRRRVLLEQKFKCKYCDISEWRENPITLEYEHIDGDNTNNNRDNVICLCPNCHSQTPTFRGRNKRNQRMKVSDEQLLKSLIKHDWNMRQALIEVNLSPRGGNYKRCHYLKRSIQ